MSLLDIQRSLVGFARGSTREYRNCNNLTLTEQYWLELVLNSSGLQVTQQTQQWWRMTRVCSAAPLTIALLKRTEREELIYEYITSEPVRTLFFAAELEQFNHFLQNHHHSNDTIKLLAGFELAIKNAYQTSVSGELINRHKATAMGTMLFRFMCDPAKLLSALLTGNALPPETQEYYVIVSPHLPHYWRIATQEECGEGNLIQYFPTEINSLYRDS